MKNLIKELEGKNLFDKSNFKNMRNLFCIITEGIDKNIVNPAVNELDIITIVDLYLKNNELDVRRVLLELNEPVLINEPIKNRGWGRI